jgi:hypothetical protein
MCSSINYRHVQKNTIIKQQSCINRLFQFHNCYNKNFFKLSNLCTSKSVFFNLMWCVTNIKCNETTTSSDLLTSNIVPLMNSIIFGVWTVVGVLFFFGLIVFLSFLKLTFLSKNNKIELAINYLKGNSLIRNPEIYSTVYLNIKF